MGAETKIQWCDHTFNCWRGCQKVSPGCQHCYAEQLSLRNPKVLGEWGPGGVRVVASEAYWRQPLAWERAAAKAGERRRVFCLSLGDVFEDRPELDAPRQRLFDLIPATPHLDWLLLTKRPAVMRDWLTGADLLGARNAHAWGAGWPNVWLGVSVEGNDYRSRIDELLEVPAAVHFVSAEPLLGESDIEDRLHYYYGRNPAKQWASGGRVDWVIVGGESGPHARPCRVEWIRSLVRQCKDAGVACFVKQLGANYADVANGVCGASTIWPRDVLPAGPSRRLNNPKGGDPAEWPADLRVREFPNVKETTCVTSPRRGCR